MLGRAAYPTPWLLAELQKDWFDTCGVSSREAAVEIMSQYLSDQVELGVPVKNISRHLLGLFQGLPGARRWRRYISEHAHLDNSNVQLLRDAQAQMRPAATNHSGSARVHGDELE
jgi:tRNA-dihydrouridine synthase A